MADEPKHSEAQARGKGAVLDTDLARLRAGQQALMVAGELQCDLGVGVAGTDQQDISSSGGCCCRA
jgi:hypothetical protein